MARLNGSWLIGLIIVAVSPWVMANEQAKVSEDAGLEADSADVIVDVVGEAESTAMTYGAQSICTRKSAKRRIQVQYLVQGSQLPCEVAYFKDNGVLEEFEILWRADYQAGFCEQSVSNLVDRLKSWGWQCD